MPYAIGIDLGTTNSVVAVFRKGQVETLPVEGRTTMPSVVSVRENGAILVGQTAKSYMMLAPEATINSSKRAMGDKSAVWRIGNLQVTPVSVATFILQKLVAIARENLGEDVRDAVITIPAYFNEQQREDTRRAGEEAGLNVLRLIPEPTAAAIAYGLDKGRDQMIMVYDLGGGTFDVSILQVKGNSFEVKAVGGDSQLGGDNFDTAVLYWAVAQFQAQTGIDLFADKTFEGYKALRKLKEAAESAKIELSQANSAEISIPNILGHSLHCELTLAQYNQLIQPMLDITIQAMRKVLKDAGLTADDIDRVILVGGSTKNRAVRDVVAREIKEPYVSERVDEVVAHGGAILAANLFLPQADSDNVPIEVSEVTPHSFGIDMISSVYGEKEVVFCPIIPRQSKYPCKMGFLGSTNHPMQDEVHMVVYRGESLRLEENSKLGQLRLPVMPPSPDDVPIGALFELDADGIIHFTAVHFPITESVVPVLKHVMANDGQFDAEAIRYTEMLIARGEVKSKVVRVKSDQ